MRIRRTFYPACPAAAVPAVRARARYRRSGAVAVGRRATGPGRRLRVQVVAHDRRVPPALRAFEGVDLTARPGPGTERSGELPAIQVGGVGKAGQWRVEVDQLEAYIGRMYAQTRARIESSPSESGNQH